MNRLRWVPRNPDIWPDRCPLCEQRADRRSSGGPRTTVRCRPCGVRWKLGRRPKSFRFTDRLMWRSRHQGIDPSRWMRSDRIHRELW